MWGSGAARAGWYTPVHNIFQLNFVNLICQFDYRSELCVSYFLSILSYFLSRETLTQKELGNFAKFQFLNDKIDQICQIAKCQMMFLYNCKKIISRIEVFQNCSAFLWEIWGDWEKTNSANLPSAKWLFFSYTVFP